MNDIVKDLELIPIESVPLSESEVGENINERFSNIDKNFQTIINSEYLKGQTGDGIYAKECLFDKDSNVGLDIYKGDQLLTSGKLYQLISRCILTRTEYPGQLSNERIPNGKIVLIYQNNGDKNILISSLPYVFIDKVYLSSLRGENKPSPNRDLSCIIYFENDNFIKSSTIPKIYYDEDVAAFCWDINDVPTQLPAQGPKGDDGKQGLSIYYAECKYINKRYELISIFDPEQGKYVVGMTLENGNLILAYVVESDDDTVTSNDVVLGTYDGGIIKNNIKLNIPDISILMKGNPNNALYVSAGLNQNKNIYHSIYSDISGGNIPSLKMELVDDDGVQYGRNSQLISCYPNNIFEHNIEVEGKLTSTNPDNEILASNYKGEVHLAIGTNPKDDGKKICVRVDQGLSNLFEVPFATNAEYAKHADSATNATNAEHAKQADGATTATTATTATNLQSKPVLKVNDNKQIQITVGGKTSDAFTVPFAEYSKYSGYSINPIVISAAAEETNWQFAALEPNKINYVWIANGEPSENIKLQIDLPVLGNESYVSISDSLNEYIGVCQCVLLVDAHIQLNVYWKRDGCNVQYSMEQSLLDPSGAGVKEIIFTGYWNKSDGQMNVVWIVGGDTHQLVAAVG